MLEGVHDVVFTTYHVRYLHLDVIHHVDQVEDVGAIGALYDHVGGVVLIGVVYGDVAAHQVVQGHNAVSLETETPYGTLTGAGDFIAVLIALVGGRALVYAAHLYQLVEVAVVNIFALALEVRFAGAAFALALIPIKPQPAHAGENGFHGVFYMTLLVCVFYAKNESAAHFAGEKIIEQSGAGTTDVQIAGGRRCEACTYSR